MSQETDVPPIPSSSFPVEKLIDGHEARIQRLENIASATSSEIAVHGVRLEELGTKVDTVASKVEASQKAITDKLDANSDSFAERMEACLAPVTHAVEGLKETVVENTSRIGVLEDSHEAQQRAHQEVEDKRKARSAKITALLWTAIGALVSIAIKDGLPALLKLLH